MADSPAGGVRVPGRPGDPWRRAGPAHRYPCGLGVPGGRARPQGQARRAFPVPRLFDAGKTQGRVRGRARGQSRLRAGDLSPASWRSRARRTDGSRSTGGASRSSGRSRCAASTRTRRSTIWDQGRVDAELADRLGRVVAAAHAERRPVVEAEPWLAALATFLEQNEAAFRAAPDLFPADEVPASIARPRRARPLRPLLLARGPPRPDPARPWRPASRQYRADRRTAGPVRCDRVRSADRGGRRALRPRLPGHGPDRARPEAGGQHRAQPLPRRDAPDEDLDALAALPLFLSLRAAIRAKVTAARCEPAGTDKRAAIAQAAEPTSASRAA